MEALPRSVLMMIESAEGWLMLGNPIEAAEEIDQVCSQYRYHPMILATRWQIYCALQWWEVAWVISKFLCEKEPECPTFWICQANSLRHCKGIDEARDLLLHVASRFPNEPVIAYNLACYACQLGRMGEACKCLLRAFQLDQTRKLKELAARDPDLTPLWRRVEPSVLLTFQTPEMV